MNMLIQNVHPFFLSPLTQLILIPALSAIMLIILRLRQASRIWLWTVCTQLLTSLVTVLILEQVRSQIKIPQMLTTLPWIERFDIFMSLAVDQTSLTMIVLVSLTSLFTTLFMQNERNFFYGAAPLHHPSLYAAMLLLVQSFLYLTFLSTNLFTFYIAWELALVPIFFLLLIWGDPVHGRGVALKLFLYTLLGSLAMLLAILYLVTLQFKTTGLLSFDYSMMKRFILSIASLQQTPLLVCCLAFTLAFVIKIPLVPFHDWQPESYRALPTSGAIYLAAMLAKMGTYGLMRFSVQLFPSIFTFLAPYLLALAILSLLYGALMVLKQADIKHWIAYSSISHAGVIVAGIATLTATAHTGALYQMLNHALLVMALFWVAHSISLAFGSTSIAELPSGLATQVPLLAIFFFMTLLTLVALPGTNGFVGEWMILLGVAQKSLLWAAPIALSMVVGAIYALTLYQRLMFGLTSAFSSEPLDLPKFQSLLFALLVALFVGAGLFPHFFYFKFNL